MATVTSGGLILALVTRVYQEFGPDDDDSPDNRAGPIHAVLIPGGLDQAYRHGA